MAQIATQQAITRRTKPLSRPTAFDINVKFDIYNMQQAARNHEVDSKNVYPGTHDPATFRVHEGEILYTMSDNPHYSSKDFRCMSALNGQRVQGDDPYRHFRLVGVAVTGFEQSKDPLLQGFVATMGGFVTMVNNGPDTIRAGRIVICDVPTPENCCGRTPNNRTLGNPREKILIGVREYDPENDEDRREWVLGQAMSSAKPGQVFDVCLGTQP